MLTPDERARALRFLHAHAPPGALLQCGVTGAHAYGFLSPDSDVDLKGLHLAPTEQVLGLDAALDRALSESTLPPEVPNRDAMSAWLVARRMR